MVFACNDCVWSHILLCIPYFTQNRYYSKVFYICSIAHHHRTFYAVFKPRGSFLLFCRSGNKAVLQRFLASVPKQFLATAAFRPIGCASTFSWLGHNIGFGVRFLFFVFFFLLHLFFLRAHQVHYRVYREKHFPNLHIPSNVHNVVQVFVTCF